MRKQAVLLHENASDEELCCLCPVAYFTKDVDPRIAKTPQNFNGDFSKITLSQ